METTAPALRGLRGSLCRLALAGALAGATLLASGTASAGPFQELKTAYNKALGQYNNLELEAAIAILDEAIAAAGGDDAKEPALAPLLVLRAGIIFSNTGDADATKEALARAVEVDYFAQVPGELRGETFQALLEEVREAAGSTPDEALRFTPPEPACGDDLELEVVVSNLVDGGQVALYWRPEGDGEFKSVSMDTFGNVAIVTLLATEHGDRPIEYFFYVFDGDEKELASKGDQDNPMRHSFGCADSEESESEPESAPEPTSGTFQRFAFNLGFGTGVGIAHGAADLTYRQYSPAFRDRSSGEQFVYGMREYSCALARWNNPDGNLPGDSVAFLGQLGELQALEGGLPPGSSFFAEGTTPETIALAYNAGYCGERHPVQRGLASAPFHIAPEFGFAITEKLMVSVFARLQVVTGSKVYRDDPNGGPVDRFVRTAYDFDRRSPEGVRVRPPFAWGVGAKVKYFLGDPSNKFRLFVGGYGGYGVARLRVNMGFSNDRNGNSIPDDREIGFDLRDENLPFDPVTNPCTAVWPYNNGCVPGPGDDPSNPGDVDRAQALFKAQDADKAPRIDTVGIGRGFLGGTFGFHYQLAKNFGIFGELQVGGWFARTSSLLFDLNVGPAITF